MTKRPPKDIAASVRGRLEQKARAGDRPFEELLQYYAMERLLYRLTMSPYAERFVLKGALMLAVWRAAAYRPTRDIDLLGRMPNDVESVVAVFRDVCQQSVEEDGLLFDSERVQGRIIKEDADYAGVRVTFLGHLQRSRLPMQIDVGFGDVVSPQPGLIDYPALLDFKAPRLLSYPRETLIAEKFEAMTLLGELNTRMKDFFDIWLLSRQFDFDGASLGESIQKTFAHRGTTISSTPAAWTDDFVRDGTKQTQWTAFMRKSRIVNSPAVFSEVVERVREFLQPLAAAIETEQPFHMVWKAPGPWSPAE